MTTKTYRTRELKGYVLHLMIDGKLNSISFKRGCTVGSTATFTTSDPKIQEKLESLKAFGCAFYLESTNTTNDSAPTATPETVIETAPEQEKEVVDMLDAQTFKNLVELRNALKDKGIDVSQITNVKAAENIAKKNGYNYTVEKNA